MQTVWERLAALLSVKSVITIMMTAVFCILAVRGEVTGQQFITIFSVVIAFYFGTQTRKGGQGQ